MPHLTIQQAFDLALQHHRAGRLHEAEELYRQVLAHEAGHADARHLLGVIAYQAGRHEAAVDLIRQAIALHPNFPEAQNNLGQVLKDTGQLEEAIAAYRQAIALKPDFPEAHSNLGHVLKDQGRLDEAIVAYRQAVALKPESPEAHCNLGNTLTRRGQLDEAIAAYRQAVALQPGFLEAHYNLGHALKDLGRLDDATAAYRQAIALKPCFPEAYNNLGTALADQGQPDEAIAAYRQAIALNPNYAAAHANLGAALKDKGHWDEAIAACRQALALNADLPEAHLNLGNALREKGQLDEAVAACRQAIAVKPDFPQAHYNLGIVLDEKGHLNEAIVAYRQAIALQPAYPEAHYNLAMLLLYRGDFAAGWTEHEWRWKCQSLRSLHRALAQPQWDGGPLTGRTLLVRAEQGLGDTLQFFRYIPHLAARGGRILLECQTELHRLLQDALPLGRHQLLTRRQPFPAFDLHCPLLSLPLIFRTTLDTIPHDVPYLHADPRLVTRWRDRLAADPGPLKVGLAWAGSKFHKNDRNRSLPLAAFAPLARVPNISFYSLQKEDTARQATHPPDGMDLADFTSEFADFADTAAFIANLDLIISVDTSVVHLAGALAKPVWVLLPFAPDWRWLQDRADSPWYPTMRLFRQLRPADWPSVVSQAADALLQFVASHSSRP